VVDAVAVANGLFDALLRFLLRDTLPVPPSIDANTIITISCVNNEEQYVLTLT
jgi:hypothetical protein